MSLSSVQIRNFVIIAHIDHGKSTLADRMLEITHTVDPRKMKPQLLDTMDLERERGITIKMQPVRMLWHSGGLIEPERPERSEGQEVILNLIDTPGHIDFSYEVSRALAAVEAAVLLADATQGVQAQTLTNLSIAQELGLVIIPVINKIDLPEARVEETERELVELLNISPGSILRVSARTGEGVGELLEAIAKRVPSPDISSQADTDILKALIFDSRFESHRGVITFVRIMSGSVRAGDKLRLLASGISYEAKEVGTFAPGLVSKSELTAGEIGYIVTAIKNPGEVKIGDTIVKSSQVDRALVSPLPGYKEPRAMVWASFFPEGEDQFEALGDALSRLKLNDAALTFEVESSPILGRSFACGFLGMLHLEIVAERLQREFGLSVVTTAPSVAYQVTFCDGSQEVISSPAKFPPREKINAVMEPWLRIEIILPTRYLGGMITLVDAHEGAVVSTETFGGGGNAQPTIGAAERIRLVCEMPLREVITDFFDALKSASSGYASMSYEPGDLKAAEVERLDILVADELVPAFSKIISKRSLPFAARSTVEALKEILPRQLFVLKIQAVAAGRIVASASISALKKDVTGYLYGGDRSRKMKLWKKQKRGKERLREHGKIHIPAEVFLKMLKR